LTLNSNSLGAAIQGNCDEHNSEELVSREVPAIDPGLLDVETRETDEANLGEQRSAEHFLTNSEPSSLSILESVRHKLKEQGSSEPIPTNNRPPGVANSDGPFPLMNISVFLNDRPYPARALTDTGANGNYVAESWVQFAKIDPSLINPPVGMSTKTANNKPLEILGWLTLLWAGKKDSKVSESAFEIAKDLTCDIIIGKETLHAKQVFLKNPDPQALRNSVPELRSKFYIDCPKIFTH
jgi:hypothetical protein